MPHKVPFSFDGVEHSALLLVEGIDDARFFNAYLNRGLGIIAVQIVRVGGNPGFRPFLSQGLRNASGLANLRRLGIVTDADTDATAAFQRVRNALADAGFPGPPLRLAKSSIRRFERSNRRIARRQRAG